MPAVVAERTRPSQAVRLRTDSSLGWRRRLGSRRGRGTDRARRRGVLRPGGTAYQPQPIGVHQSGHAGSGYGPTSAAHQQQQHYVAAGQEAGGGFSLFSQLQGPHHGGKRPFEVHQWGTDPGGGSGGGGCSHPQPPAQQQQQQWDAAGKRWRST